MFRLVKRYRLEGDAGLIHRLRGKSSNRGYPKKVKARVLELYWQPEYRDYGPTLFTEILASDHKIRVNHETVRRWLAAAGGSNVQRKKRPHRSKRPRRQAVGDMVLFDGSDHDWFEGRGRGCVRYFVCEQVCGLGADEESVLEVDCKLTHCFVPGNWRSDPFLLHVT